MSATGTPAMEEEEEDGGVRLRYRTIADLLNELDGLHSAAPSRSSPGGRGAVGPASDEAIQALKDVVVITGQRPECVICLDDGTTVAGWKEMPCGHQFHGGCLEKWLRVHRTCPMCRHQMPTASPPAEEEEDDD